MMDRGMYNYLMDPGTMPVTRYPQTNYVEFSMIDQQSQIIIDTIVDLNSIASSTNYAGKRFIYNAYRIFTLREGKSEKGTQTKGDHDDSKQLYLTTMNHILPIKLSLVSSSSSSSFKIINHVL